MDNEKISIERIHESVEKLIKLGLMDGYIDEDGNVHIQSVNLEMLERYKENGNEL